MKTLSLLALLSILFVVRALRWLAIFQQKEYRLDRMMAFLGVPEGKSEVWRFYQPKSQWHPKLWKRPRITPRILVVALLSLLIGLLPLFLVVFLQVSLAAKILFSILVLVAEFIFLPLIIAISVAVSAIPARIKVWLELKKAASLINKTKPLIIGIGGSYGKTSTKYLLRALLGNKYSVFMTPKSYNTAFSIARSINEGYKQQSVVLLEYGAYKQGEIRYLTKWFKPNHAVITGFTEQHLHLFGSVEASFKAESELAAAINNEGKIWYNADDPRVKNILDQASSSRGQLINYSKNDFDQITIDNFGFMSFKIKNMLVSTNLVGDHYATNLSGAIKVAGFLGVSDSDIKFLIEKFAPDERFMRSYQGNNCWILDDAGTSNPVGFSSAIKLAERMNFKNKYLLTGGIVDLGSESERIHKQLARESQKIFDKVFFVTDVGREEFLSVFGSDLVIDHEEIISSLSEVNEQTLVVIEGRMPGWLEGSLKSIGVSYE